MVDKSVEHEHVIIDKDLYDAYVELYNSASYLTNISGTLQWTVDKIDALMKAHVERPPHHAL